MPFKRKISRENLQKERKIAKVAEWFWITLFWVGVVLTIVVIGAVFSCIKTHDDLFLLLFIFVLLTILFIYNAGIFIITKGAEGNLMFTTVIIACWWAMSAFVSVGIPLSHRLNLYRNTGDEQWVDTVGAKASIWALRKIDWFDERALIPRVPRPSFVKTTNRIPTNQAPIPPAVLACEEDERCIQLALNSVPQRR